MNRHWKILTTVLVCLLAAGNLMAQSARGGIQGTVKDSAGVALPGVTVVIDSEAMQGTRSTVTDTNGTFRFPLVPPGVYTAVFALSGYQRYEQQNVRVGLEQTITLDVNMSSTFTEEVMVTAESPVIDTTSPAIGSDFNQTLLNDVPLGREFNDITFLATGAVDGGGLANDALGGNPSIMGASALENRYVVDQLDTTDVAEGRAGTQISTSFISEMQVKVGGYEAEYGGALGGVVNMITKSGGNEFHGDVFGYFSNDSMWADAEVPETRGDSRTVDSEWDVGFTIGGKIITDKLWFFAGYNPNNFDQNIVNDVYGIDDTILQTNDFIRTYEKGFYSGKLTWQLNQNNSITATALGDPTTITNDFSTSNFVDSPFAVTDQFYDTDEGGLNWGVNWNSVLGQSLMLEASYGHHQSKQEYVPNTDVTAYQDQTDDGDWSGGASDTFFGGPQFQQLKDDRTRDQVRVALSWFLGQNHE
ncbi:MAG: TonB-dependent receptor, partial [Acidobacteria bacterium]|nr:TonB-dependent receptor [Acidobacteriota bacterium]